MEKGSEVSVDHSDFGILFFCSKIEKYKQQIIGDCTGGIPENAEADGLQKKQGEKNEKDSTPPVEKSDRRPQKLFSFRNRTFTLHPRKRIMLFKSNKNGRIRCAPFFSGDNNR